MNNAERMALIAMAIMDLRRARDHLREAGADKAAASVARALKSAEGAYLPKKASRAKETA